MAGLAGIPVSVRSRAAEAGLHLEATLQAAFDGASGPPAADQAGGTADDQVAAGGHNAPGKQEAGAPLPAEEAATAQQLAALLEQSGGGGHGGGLDLEAAGAGRLAALQSLWQQSRRLMGAPA